MNTFFLTIIAFVTIYVIAHSELTKEFRGLFITRASDNSFGKLDSMEIGVEPYERISIQSNELIQIDVRGNEIITKNFNYVNNNDSIVNISAKKYSSSTEIIVIKRYPFNGMTIVTIIFCILVVVLIISKCMCFQNVNGREEVILPPV